MNKNFTSWAVLALGAITIGTTFSILVPLQNSWQENEAAQKKSISNLHHKIVGEEKIATHLQKEKGALEEKLSKDAEELSKKDGFIS